VSATIAVTTYNRGRYLRQCLDSALGQTYQPTQVVVVDDGSTRPHVMEILQDYPQVTLIRHDTNRGCAAAKNTALRAATGTYVALLDSDDTFAPDFLRACTDHLEGHPEIGVVYTDAYTMDGHGTVSPDIRRFVDPWTIEDVLRTCNVAGDNWVARRSVLLRTALHFEHPALPHITDVDGDLFYQLDKVATFGHLRQPLMTIRLHEHGMTYNSGRRFDRIMFHAANLVAHGYSLDYADARLARWGYEVTDEVRAAVAAGQALGELRRRGAITTDEIAQILSGR
jgi:glycosyltransferase involved in cell wall biosynthesis